jgi:adenine phosphoribosyltransferase
MLTASRVLAHTRVVEGFPTPGFPFRDITPIFANPTVFADIIDWMASEAMKMGATAIGGIEARGFPFAAAVAHHLCLPLVIFRKPSKLPGKVYAWSYKKEYGTDTLEAHMDSIVPGSKIVIIDDVLATGGTADAAGQISMLGGAEPGFIFLFEVGAIDGRKALPSQDVAVITKI